MVEKWYLILYILYYYNNIIYIKYNIDIAPPSPLGSDFANVEVLKCLSVLPYGFR